MKRSLALLFGLILTVIPTIADVDAPNVINYQGRLLNAAGANVANGTYTVQFKIYDAPTGSTVLYGTIHTVVVSEGYFNVILGEGGIPVAGASYSDIVGALSVTSTPYLGVTITADSSGNISNPAEISPRLRFLASPFAIVAKKAAYAETANTSGNSRGLNGFVPSDFVIQRNADPQSIAGPVTMNSTVVINQTLQVVSHSFLNNVVVNGNLDMTQATFTSTGGGIVPVGGIIMWTGVTAPKDWALCDGTGGYFLIDRWFNIPDLRSKFIIGASPSYPPNSAGGASTVTLTGINIPDHRHLHKDTVWSESGAWYVGDTPDGLQSGTDWSGNNSWPGSNSGTDFDNHFTWIYRWSGYMRGDFNSPQPNDGFSIIPPYYALAYIIRLR